MFVNRSESELKSTGSVRRSIMDKINPLKWPALLLFFGLPTVLNLFACNVAIPYFDSLNVFPVEISYFLSVGILIQTNSPIY